MSERSFHRAHTSAWYERRTSALLQLNEPPAVSDHEYLTAARRPFSPSSCNVPQK